jgi:phosphomannomutase
MITITKTKGGDVVIGGDQKPPSAMIKLDCCIGLLSHLEKLCITQIVL